MTAADSRPAAGASYPAADLLLVFAGAQFRKDFAVQAWREGAARALAIAVARFEWRKVPTLGLADDGGLLTLVDATPAPKRLFLLVVEGDRVRARLARKGRWGTWSEAKAFASLVRERRAATVLVCTSAYHLPRTLQTLRRALRAGARAGFDRERGALPELIGYAAPEPPTSPLHATRRWRSPRAWRALLREAFKRVLYGIGVPMAIEPMELDADVRA